MTATLNGPSDADGASGVLRTWSLPGPGEPTALDAAATRLSEDFGDIYGAETIRALLHSSYELLAGRPEPSAALSLTAERFARQRLYALAKSQGRRDDGRPVVLFLCVHNAGRSQMGLGFFTHLAGDAGVGWSGGSQPGRRVDPVAVQLMCERGIDITGEFPKPWTEEILRAVDLVVAMGGADACPALPAERCDIWDVAAPSGPDLAAARPVRDEIERRVRALLDRFGIPALERTDTPPSGQSADGQGLGRIR